MGDKFRTPVVGNTSDKDFDDVYEPAEDSFLLLDVLEKEDKFLQKLQPSMCVEVGCGSGVCITFLSQMLEQPALFICTDINPKAAEMTKQTAQKNGQMNVQPVLCNLTDAIEDRLQGKVDVLLFNPPYVVTLSEEVASGGITASWAGGVKGREVTDRFLPRVSSLISPDGVFYLVVIQENDPDDIGQVMSQQGFQMSCEGSRRAGREHLSILKFTRHKKS